MDKLKLAIVGCGAVAELCHLPALVRSDRVEAAVLVDKNLWRARALAGRYRVSSVAADYREIIGRVDGAIVALPNYLHAPVAIDLLQHGVHVLVEKPMALRTHDCDAMMAAANETGALLAVGLPLRFVHASQFVKQLLDSQVLGDIVSVELCHSATLKWPMQSDYLFRREMAGGGVLIDIGSHLLDLLLWWLGDYESVEYYDDAMGGVEADCALHLRFRCGARGLLELSRTRTLRNTCTMYGQRGTLEIKIHDFNPTVRLKMQDQHLVLTGQVMQGGVAARNWNDIFLRQDDEFLDAILCRREPFVPGREGKRAVQLIEASYAVRQPLIHPWMAFDAPALGVLEANRDDILAR